MMIRRRRATDRTVRRSAYHRPAAGVELHNHHVSAARADDSSGEGSVRMHCESVQHAGTRALQVENARVISHGRDDGVEQPLATAEVRRDVKKGVVHPLVHIWQRPQCRREQQHDNAAKLCDRTADVRAADSEIRERVAASGLQRCVVGECSHRHNGCDHATRFGDEQNVDHVAGDVPQRTAAVQLHIGDPSVGQHRTRDGVQAATVHDGSARRRLCRCEAGQDAARAGLHVSSMGVPVHRAYRGLHAADTHDRGAARLNGGCEAVQCSTADSLYANVARVVLHRSHDGHQTRRHECLRAPNATAVDGEVEQRTDSREHDCAVACMAAPCVYDDVDTASIVHRDANVAAARSEALQGAAAALAHGDVIAVTPHRVQHGVNATDCDDRRSVGCAALCELLNGAAAVSLHRDNLCMSLHQVHDVSNGPLRNGHHHLSDRVLLSLSLSASLAVSVAVSVSVAISISVSVAISIRCNSSSQATMSAVRLGPLENSQRLQQHRTQASLSYVGRRFFSACATDHGCFARSGGTRATMVYNTMKTSSTRPRNHQRRGSTYRRCHDGA
jgi:hypothetical protein